MVSRDLIVELHDAGANTAILIPKAYARRFSFLAGTKVRVVMLDGEIRIRPVTAPRAYDLESLDDYRDRIAKEESEWPARWER